MSIHGGIATGTRAVLGLGLVVCCLTSVAGERRRIEKKDVELAVVNGRKVLLASIERGLQGGFDTRGRGLTLLALLSSGVKPDDPQVSLAIANLAANWKDLMSEQYSGSYQGGILLMLLARTDQPRYRPVSAEIARRLQRFQQLNGGWGDNSRTQFALLGLKAAEDMEIDVPDSVFEAAHRYVVGGQNADGGWGYNPGARQSYGSMTAAGVTSLYICRTQLSRNSKTCGQRNRDLNLEAGLAWLAANFTVRQNPGMGNAHQLYYLYGLERVGVILARRYLGGSDWYREGAEFLINTQNRRDGSWSHELYDTEYAMLFLGEGSKPLGIQKLDYGPGWDSDSFDAKDLTERASKELGEPMTYMVVDQGAAAEELLRAPMLYLQGHDAFVFKPGFRTALRRYLDNGGFLFASACCGSPDFDRSFREEMKQLYPDVPLESLPAAHPIYHSPHRIQDEKAFMLETMNTGCRYAIFYAPHDVCCGWGGCLGCRDTKQVSAESSHELGVNLLAFAIGLQPLRDRLEEVKLSGNEQVRRLPPDTLRIGRLYHGGGSQLDPAALPNLLQTFREQMNMKRDATTVEVSPLSDELGDFPLLYMIGFKAFAMSDREVQRIRTYLDQGGFLFAECGCGRDEFDQAFRVFIKKLYPESDLKRVESDDAILRAPNEIKAVRYKKSVAARYPDQGTKPWLELIKHEGRTTVVYSRFNLSCELQGRSDPSSLGVLNPDAYKLGVNIIVYALSR